MERIPPEVRMMPEQEQKLYHKAHQCRHCTDTFDSRGRYVSTYCHRFHKHMLGFANGSLMLCGNCTETKREEGDTK